MSATSFCETLFAAVSNLYTMLTEYRGLVPHDDQINMFKHFDLLRRMPVDSPYYTQTCELVYRLNLMVVDKDKPANKNTQEFNRHKDDGVWLALHARNLLFVRPVEANPKHPGIAYSLLLVVFTAPSGPESMAKMDFARQHMDKTILNLQKSGFEVGAARVLRLVLGKELKNVVPVTIDGERVSTEVWFTSELQKNPLTHVLANTHRVYLNMTKEELDELPESTRKAAIGDTSKLDVLQTTEMVSRWHGFVPGQVICVNRSHLFEGGTGYHLRCVGDT